MNVMRKGGIEPPRVFSPQDPESCASTNSATFAQRNIKHLELDRTEQEAECSYFCDCLQRYLLLTTAYRRLGRVLFKANSCNGLFRYWNKRRWQHLRAGNPIAYFPVPVGAVPQAIEGLGQGKCRELAPRAIGISEVRAQGPIRATGIARNAKHTSCREALARDFPY